MEEDILVEDKTPRKKRILDRFQGELGSIKQPQKGLGRDSLDRLLRQKGSQKKSDGQFEPG